MFWARWRRSVASPRRKSGQNAPVRLAYSEGVFSPTTFLRCVTGLSLLFPALAFAAQPITGTVINRTNGKPAAGDEVVLIQLQQGMQESTRSTTDSRGHFTLQVPDDGIHLVRVTHQKATYFQPVQPGQSTVAVTVYDAGPQVDGVRTNVEELHIEATPSELHVVEVLQVLNESSPQRTQFGPNGFDFYLPKGSLLGRTGAITQGGMPVQTPAVPLSDPGHFTFLFPIRPGETQFGIAYTVPYTGKFTFTPHLTSSVKTFAVLLPTGMTLTPGSNVGLTAQAGKPGVQTFLTQDVSPDHTPEFTVTGTGTLPEGGASDAGTSGGGPNAATANPGSNNDANAPPVSNSDLAGGRGLNNPLNEGGDRDPWSKYKWWILAGLALLLAGAAGVLLRKPGDRVGGGTLPPADPGSPHTGPGTHAPAANTHNALLAALKEELFALETERLQRHITEPDYREAKSALELILRRALMRAEPTRSGLLAAANPGLDAPAAPVPEPALTGREGA